jgi:uncharacterized protein (DUF697 family)
MLHGDEAAFALARQGLSAVGKGASAIVTAPVAVLTGLALLWVAVKVVGGLRELTNPGGL